RQKIWDSVKPQLFILWRWPDGISVANKTGETDEESHDVAIIFGEKTDYILCVMSTGVDVMGAGNAGNIIKQISSLAYETLN
ncbi:MAG: class A beta-lactamase-related serine hydrolase, partial [Clostridiales bacterium]|nr:class A beta-lactamase-related serine hydrolase [Clostridiales bacterium]